MKSRYTTLLIILHFTFFIFQSAAYSQTQKVSDTKLVYKNADASVSDTKDEDLNNRKRLTDLVVIKGNVFFDVDGDSIRGPQEYGFIDVTLEIVRECGGSAIYQKIVTSSVGSYLAYIEEPGAFELRLVQSSVSKFDLVTEQSICFTAVASQQQEIMFDIGLTTSFCDENSLSGSICETAPLMCNLPAVATFCSGLPTMEGLLSGLPLCPDKGIFNNSSWFQFTAGYGDYSIAVTPHVCSPGVGGALGMQAAIFQQCDDLSNPILCFGNCEVDQIRLSTKDLIPGNIYYLVLDGCAGSICDYKIEVDGSFKPFVLSNLEVVLNKKGSRCTDDPLLAAEVSLKDTIQGTYYNNPIMEYRWVITEPVKKGGTPIQNYQITNENYVEYYMAERGFYEVCLHKLLDYCDEVEPNICKRFYNNTNLEVENLGEIILTAAEFPWSGDRPDNNGFLPVDKYGNQWQGPPINRKDIISFPQTFTYVVDADSTYCSYQQLLKVKTFFSEINIYPNPTFQSLNLEVEGTVDILSYKIIDHMGKEEVPNTPLTNIKDHINISTLKSGWYQIQFITSEGTFTKRFEKGL